MNRRLVAFACSVASCAIVLSCQKNNEVQPQPEQLIPLQVGNQWQYRVYLYDYDGTMYDSTGVYTRTVLRDTTIHHSTWYILNDRTIVQNAPDGYAYYNVAGNVPVLIYPGASAGARGYSYKYPNYDLTVYTVPSQDVIPLPASRQKFSGKLYKVQYEYTYSNPTTTQIQKREEWLVPGVGLARWNTFFRDTNKLQYRRELISYTLK